MNVSHLLQSKSHQGILSVKPSDKIRDAVAILGEKRIGALIVSRDGAALDGILSERDIVRELAKSGGACLDQPVESLMTRKVTSCAPADTTQSLMERMTDGRFRHMPVIENGALVGVISIGDVVKARLEEMAAENSALTDMITGNA